MLCPLLFVLRAWLGACPTLHRAALAAGVFVVVSLLPIQAADTNKKLFNIQAGDAPRTLKQFAEQAGGDRLLYSVDAVKGVQTRPVEGKFTPREALEHMLMGSNLIVTEDAQTGALTVYRRDALLKATSPGPTSRDRGEADSDLIKKKYQEPPSGPERTDPNFYPNTQLTEPSVKKRNPLSLLIGWATIALASNTTLPAADGAGGTGSIVGRVQNVATGQYLYNARVTVRGTDHLAFTNEIGAYRLVDVPSGNVIVEVMYTGLDPVQVSLQLPAGTTLTRNFDLSSAERYGGEGDVYKLGQFVVASSREMDGQALAVNEQRFAGNIKNVLSSDTHGDVTQGSISEFLKHMPGITANYGDANADRISVRGLADHLTAITFDGAPIASSSYQPDTRAFHFTQVSINTISRVEVTKVPTPATPADSVGGSINMVSKTAFERSKPEFRYRVFFSLNSRELNFRKTSYPLMEKDTYKAMPGFDVSYTNPVNERFGYVFTANVSLQYNPQDISVTTWRGATTTGTTVSPTNPYLASYQLIDNPKTVYRLNSGLKLDWGVTKNSVLSLGLQANYHRDNNTSNTWTVNAGTNGTSAVAGGTPLTYSPTETHGPTGRGSVNIGNGGHHYGGPLLAANLRYRFENENWRIDSGVSYSKSTSTFRYLKYGHFNTLQISLKETAARVVFTEIERDKPRGVRAFTNDGREIDLYDPDSYRITSATNNLRDSSDTRKSVDLNIRRELRSLPFGMAIQGGGSVRQQIRDNRGVSVVYDYVPPNGDNSATPYASSFVSASPFGFTPPWFSSHLAYKAWENNASLFTMAPARLVSNETNRITRSEFVDETVSALYLQADLRLLKNRLRVLTGVRYEKTTDDARGPLVDAAAVWVRNPDGSFARNAAGQRIRKPEAGAVGSMEQLRLTHQERGYYAHRSYDDFYPSAHLTYNITENLLVRFAWAQTYGRPNFNEIIPNSTVAENDIDPEDVDPEAGTVQGTITIRNTGLLPWSADNYDLSLEYYTNQGGVFSAGLFVKDIKNFFGAAQRIATAADLDELGLDPRYLGWRINTKFNAGDARISGAEFNVSQSLSILGEWGRQFHVFVNGIKLELDGGDEADWRGYVPELLNWGVTFTRSPITFMAKWQYRGESQDAPNANLGPTGAFSRTAARTMLDLNLDYQISRKFSLFANARNIFNVRYEAHAYGPDTPDYARQNQTRNYGTQFALGVKGTF